MLVGGKRKGKKVRNKRFKKKNKSKNDNVEMKMLVGPRIMVVHGPIILHGGRGSYPDSSVAMVAPPKVKAVQEEEQVCDGGAMVAPM